MTTPTMPSPATPPAGAATRPAATVPTAAPAADTRAVGGAVWGWQGLLIWLPGLLVAIGAIAATAHGLHEVALAARVPAGIAWLYPLITDGLALVAYAATARLTGSPRRYAWMVVLVAAGLSGLAQASLLASDPAPPSLPVVPDAMEGQASGFVASAPLRFGVGAWPAIAAAVVAHLLYLLADTAPDRRAVRSRDESSARPVPSVEPLREQHQLTARPTSDRPVSERPAMTSESEPSRRTDVQAATSRTSCTARRDDEAAAERSGAPVSGPSDPVSGHAAPVQSRPMAGSAGERARAAASRHAQRHSTLPTVSQLMDLAEVSRGTAGEVLKAMRAQPTPLHLVSEPTPESAADAQKRRAQP